jgi:hypothetical protein
LRNTWTVRRKRAAEMINERMALAAERACEFGAADCGNPAPGIL